MHTHICYIYIYTKIENVFPSIGKGHNPQSTNSVLTHLVLLLSPLMQFSCVTSYIWV